MAVERAAANHFAASRPRMQRTVIISSSTPIYTALGNRRLHTGAARTLLASRGVVGWRGRQHAHIEHNGRPGFINRRASSRRFHPGVPRFGRGTDGRGACCRVHLRPDVSVDAQSWAFVLADPVLATHLLELLGTGCGARLAPERTPVWDEVFASRSAPDLARARHDLHRQSSGHRRTTDRVVPAVCTRVEYDYRQAFVEQFGSQFVTDALAFAVLLLVARGRLLALREARLEAELTRAHLETLRLEIQPHFLFNTLNSVAALIRLKANDKALDMLLKLSELMRRTLDRPAGHLVALGDEVDFVKRYIDLHRSRFSDRLDVTYAVDSDCQDVAVPPFLLQPLVENALRHGMAKHAGPCRLELGARFDRDLVLVWVADDGAGLPAGFDIARDAGTGLSNIRRRLDELYGPSATLGIRPAERAGTVVDIAVPRTFVNRLERAAG